MRPPEVPKPTHQLLEELGPWSATLTTAVATAKGPEVEGRYLHWDELRHRPPPDGLTGEEWWLVLSLSRGLLRTSLPLDDKAGKRLSLVRSDSLQRLLHFVDRQMGGPMETADPQLATHALRDRYLMRSLMEEAITSSQLEGASTTRQAAKQMLLSGRKPATRDERMISNNFRAMELLRGKLEEPLSLPFLLELHQVLTEGTLPEDDVARLRRSDEPVIVQDVGDGRVLHVPPEADELPERLEALCRFANDASEDAFIHPAVRAICLHFALAYEHPFVDGNGRTARALFYWSMLRQGYWLAEFLSISRVIQQGPAQYSRAFLHAETDAGDLTYFLLHQLEVVRRATNDLHDYLRRKSSERQETERMIREGNRFNHRQRALLAHALRHPGARYTIGGYQRENRVVYQTARRDLLDLAEADCLVQSKVARAFVFDAPKDLEKRLKQRR